MSKNEPLPDWILLSVFPSRLIAEMSQRLLEREQVRSIVLVDDGGGLYPALAFVSGAKLLVHDDDLSRAREILNLSEDE